MTVIKGNVRSNHIHVLVSAPSHLSPAKIAQYLKGKSSYRPQREFPELRKKYWGRHLWSRGYFSASVGAVTEDQIKQYIENQLDSPDSFRYVKTNSNKTYRSSLVLVLTYLLPPAGLGIWLRKLLMEVVVK